MDLTKENVKVMNPADSKIPEGPVAEKWTNYKAHQKLVNPANKRRLDIIVVGIDKFLMSLVVGPLLSDRTFRDF